MKQISNKEYEKYRQYGIKKDDPAYKSESACVALLMKRYQELTAR